MQLTLAKVKYTVFLFHVPFSHRRNFQLLVEASFNAGGGILSCGGGNFHLLVEESFSAIAAEKSFTWQNLSLLMEESFVSAATIRLDRGGFSPQNGSFNWLKFGEEGRLIINYYHKYCSVIQFFIVPRISKEPMKYEVRYCKLDSKFSVLEIFVTAAGSK